MAFSTTDTVVAIATPPGRGGIGVVRLSGPEACVIAGRLISHADLEPRRATFTKVRLKPDTPSVVPPSSGAALSSVASGFSRTVDIGDQVIVTYFPAPRSYTGEDVVEISAHGSPVVLRSIVEAAVAAGARLAERGEFTLRAFLNGRIDLPQAEAVADLIEAATPLQARAAFDQLEGTLTETIAAIDNALFDLIARLEASVDFPEEGYHFAERAAIAGELDSLLTRTCSLLTDARRGRLIREGLQVAIVGKPNVGKSTLFNALVGASRAIVTDVPGTTRDLVTEVVDIENVRVTLVDTAGLRDAQDVVEAEGVTRSLGAAAVADVVLTVVEDADDADAGVLGGVVGGAKHFLVQNKRDLHRPICPNALAVSALTGEGIDALRQVIACAFDGDAVTDFRDRPQMTNVRHAALVQRAHDALVRARSAAAGERLSEEFVLADLQDARAAFEEITGRRATDDLLAHIFSRFCIGK